MSDSVYAKPVAPRIILRPALATLFLHGCMLYLLTANWSSHDTKVVKVAPVPKVINARLVDVSEFQPKPKPKPKAKPKPKPQPKSQPVAKARPAAKAKPRPVAKATPKPAAKPKSQPKPQPKPEVSPEPRITEQELAAIARADLAKAVAEEEQVQASAAATAQEMAASYAALIQQTVVNYWSRPPSARNGMEALLGIQLIPTGEVVSVSVIKSRQICT